MTTILIIFLVNFLIVLITTPQISRLAVKTGALDFPDIRKVHDKPIPRIGGFGIFLAFVATIVLIHFTDTNVARLFTLDKKTTFFISGAVVVFGIGLIDDFHPIRPSLKLLFQIFGASLAFLGGLHIDAFYLFSLRINFGPLDYFLTIFWFLIFINAINLIDGLDGLATGIVLFVSLLMMIFSIIRNDLGTGMLFAGLAGGSLGFLRYNFKPASIFLGDGGSYFFGYMIAGLSILGGAKSQVGAVFLIPLVALGIPLVDTLLSPLRRFSIGKKLFYPDNDHVHHRLLKLGFSPRNAVLIIYTITLVLCGAAILLVNLRNEMVGLLVFILGVGAIIFCRRLGYTDYFIGTKLSDRLEDFSDDLGLSVDRRTFFNLLNEIIQANKFEDLWKNITQILDMLEFDKGSMYLNGSLKDEEFKERNTIVYMSNRPGRRKTPRLESSVILRKTPPELNWTRPPFEMDNYLFSRSILRIELPLLSKKNIHYGTLVLVKDTKIHQINHQTLRRIEDLRRTVIRKMEAMTEDGGQRKRKEKREKRENRKED